MKEEDVFSTSEWIDINEKNPASTKMFTFDIKLDCGSILLGCDRYGREFRFKVGSSGNEIFIDDSDVIEWRPHVELPKEGEE